jgi:hypothetical protein
MIEVALFKKAAFVSKNKKNDVKFQEFVLICLSSLRIYLKYLLMKIIIVYINEIIKASEMASI